eukprot:Partr_v1_DN26119_c0_g1_i3_m10483 putative SAC1 suppressor of actin mutations 1-like (yeast)
MHEQLNLYISKSAFLIEPVYSDPSALSENLVIDRDSGFLRRNVPALPTTVHESVLTIFGIFGLLRGISGDILIVITEREKVGSLNGGKNDTVYRITGTRFFPLARSKMHLSDKQASAEDYFLQCVKDMLASDTLYFSYNWDITRSMQRQIMAKNLPLWQRADNQFFFNRFLQQKLIEVTLSDSQQNLSGFILPVVSGFVSINQVVHAGHKFHYALISRRGVGRVGTRYFSRGIDADGNVSNFVETEQIVACKDQLFSHVQTRGSIPLFWKQIVNTKYKPKMVVHSTPAAKDAMKRHLEEMKANYGAVLCFSLIDTQGYEFELGQMFANVIASFQDIKYKHFDFHRECRKLQWHKISLLLDEYATDLQQQRYFHSEGDVTKELQTSVVRTNCVDCLDRTNVVQSEIARQVVTLQLRALGIFSANETIPDSKEFNNVFKNTWADNANAVSMMYSGTGALKTDFTRTGKRTHMGALSDGFNSAVRYVKNNFLDGSRQDAYDLVSGKYELSASRNIPEPVKSYRYYALASIVACAVIMEVFTVTLYISMSCLMYQNA